MAGLRPPRVPDKPVPVFAGEELPRLERACAGRSFQQRRDAAVIAVFRATGMRLSELAAIRYDCCAALILRMSVTLILGTFWLWKTPPGGPGGAG